MKHRLRSLAVAPTLWLAACSAFGPARTPPVLPLPAHYSAVAEPGTLGSADGVSQRLAGDVPPVAEWWRAYECAALDAFVAEGLAHSSSLAAARGTLKAAREQLRGQIGGNMLPSVDLEFDPSRQRTLGIPIIPQQTFLENIFVAQVQTSYTFDFFGAALLADRALAQQVRQQALQFESTRRALATNIVVAVINAASLQGQVDETVELVALGEHRAAQASARYERGSATQDEALAAVQDAASAAATLPPLRAQALAVRHTLAVLLGRMPDQAPASLSLSDLHLPAALPLAVPSELLHQRPDILAAEAAVRAAADAAGAATASMFPSLTLSAAYGRGGFDWSHFTSPIGAIWTVGASLTQPVFHGGALLARRRQYRATYDAAVAQYKQTVLSAFENVADTLESLDEDAATVKETERAAAAAAALHGSSEARYKLGAAPFYATLTAGQQYRSANVQVIRATAARLADTAALLDSMGEAQRRETHASLQP